MWLEGGDFKLHFHPDSWPAGRGEGWEIGWITDGQGCAPTCFQQGSLCMNPKCSWASRLLNMWKFLLGGTLGMGMEILCLFSFITRWWICTFVIAFTMNQKTSMFPWVLWNIQQINWTQGRDHGNWFTPDWSELYRSIYYLGLESKMGHSPMGLSLQSVGLSLTPSNVKIELNYRMPICCPPENWEIPQMLWWLEVKCSVLSVEVRGKMIFLEEWQEHKALW